LPITAGSSMVAITRTGPPQAVQVSMSMWTIRQDGRIAQPQAAPRGARYRDGPRALPPQPLRPGHCPTALGLRLGLLLRGWERTLAAPGRGDPLACVAVRGEDAMVAGEVHPRLRHQSRQPFST
jgi:hypothetical protein